MMRLSINWTLQEKKQNVLLLIILYNNETTEEYYRQCLKTAEYEQNLFQDKLIDFLDIIEQISQNNPKKGSNFTYAFEYVFKATKNTGAKYFILQAN